MRRLITFSCAGETLVGTLDEAASETGVLIVSGGNELRIGSHRGMARLGARLADAGMPTLRYDRRGIGDSTGINTGFAASAPDIAAALAALRATGVRRVMGFGNCDAATALALHGAGIDALMLANPWVVESGGELPPASAIRARYAERLKDPRTYLRLLRGGVDLAKFFKGLRKATANGSESSGLAQRIATSLVGFPGPVTVLIARRDNTAAAFMAEWRGSTFAAIRDRATLHELDSASHSFAPPRDRDWLFDRIVEAACQGSGVAVRPPAA